MSDFSSTTDLLYEVKISRQKSHQDLCKFDKADEEFQAIVNVIKIGILHLPARKRLMEFDADSVCRD